MKIRINKKHLMQGVKFKYIMANKPLIDMKISFYFTGNSFIIINHFDDNKVFKYDDYQSFRKKITDIIEKW